MFDYDRNANANNEESIEGFVQGETKTEAQEFLPTERIIRAKLYRHNDKYYLRTREVAVLLGAKQPFQFVYDLKRVLGEDAVLKGNDTESFRAEDDDMRVTFVEATDLLSFLLNSEKGHGKRYESEMYIKVINALQKIANH